MLESCLFLTIVPTKFSSALAIFYVVSLIKSLTNGVLEFCRELAIDNSVVFH